MNAWRIILATLVIFGSGVVAGGLMVSKSNPQPSTPAPAVPPAQDRLSPAPWHSQRMDFLRRIERNLSLTPEQHKRIEQILRESSERTRPLWEEIGPTLRDELRRVHEQIRAELTLEQQRQFDELIARPQFRRSDDGRRDGPPRRDDRRRDDPRPAKDDN